MQVHYDLASFEANFSCVSTVGMFDGVHLGHQKILFQVKELASQLGLPSVVFTFHPHPKYVLNPEKSQGDELKMLTSLEEKIKQLSLLGLDHLCIIPFTEEFSQWSSADFIQKIIIDQVHTKKLVIGYDHRFGKNREGSFEYLKSNEKTLGLEVVEISRHDIDEATVSSSRIRNCIAKGDLEQSKKLLGRYYTVTGKVVKGKQLGRTIGYPTANIEIDDKNKLIPLDGVYAVRVSIGDTLKTGMLNIGNNPTVPNKGRSIEVNIFEFDQDIYDITISIEFVKYLRPELKFESLDQLKSQLAQDKIATLAVEPIL